MGPPFDADEEVACGSLKNQFVSEAVKACVRNWGGGGWTSRRAVNLV